MDSLSPKSGRPLSWTHYRILLQETSPEARAWYTKEAQEQAWSVQTFNVIFLHSIITKYSCLKMQNSPMFARWRRRYRHRERRTEPKYPKGKPPYPGNPGADWEAQRVDCRPVQSAGNRQEQPPQSPNLANLLMKYLSVSSGTCIGSVLGHLMLVEIPLVIHNPIRRQVRVHAEVLFLWK